MTFLPYETQHAILHAILAHSYRHGVEPATLEARVLYDADRLDSLEASGVMRWAMTAKRGRWPEIKTYHPDVLSLFMCSVISSVLPDNDI